MSYTTFNNDQVVDTRNITKDTGSMDTGSGRIYIGRENVKLIKHGKLKATVVIERVE
jgi:hypothetical protein